MIFHLPYPPSVNHYWRRRGHQYFISAEGQRFRAAVEAIVLARPLERLAKPLKLAVKVRVFSPDRRRRDLDNHLRQCQRNR